MLKMLNRLGRTAASKWRELGGIDAEPAEQWPEVVRAVLRMWRDETDDWGLQAMIDAILEEGKNDARTMLERLVKAAEEAAIYMPELDGGMIENWPDIIRAVLRAEDDISFETMRWAWPDAEESQLHYYRAIFCSVNEAILNEKSDVDG